MSVHVERRVVATDDGDSATLVVRPLSSSQGSASTGQRHVSIGSDEQAFVYLSWADLREFALELLDLLPDDEKSWPHAIEPPD